MMTEAQVQKQLHAYLRQALPGCVLFKHRDATTAGIPDTSVTVNAGNGISGTTWLELKVRRGPVPLATIVRDVQLVTMCALANQSGRAWFVVFTFNGRGNQNPYEVDIWHPAAMFNHLQGAYEARDRYPHAWAGDRSLVATFPTVAGVIKRGGIR